MKTMYRIQYRAAILPEADEQQMEAAFRALRSELLARQKRGELYTAGLFRYRDMLFLYLELIGDGINPGHFDEEWLASLNGFLKTWPALSGDRRWVPMIPVFWFDEPKSYEQFARAQPPERQCGRIAVLRHEKAMSYVTHHQAIVAEGLLVGDRYQFISIHENILFSYFETPRDREQVNIRREDTPSLEIQKWLDADPESHFVRFEEAPDENFMVIPSVFTLF